MCDCTGLYSRAAGWFDASPLGADFHSGRSRELSHNNDNVIRFLLISLDSSQGGFPALKQNLGNYSALRFLFERARGSRIDGRRIKVNDLRSAPPVEFIC